jgi:hypothetical protein
MRIFAMTRTLLSAVILTLPLLSQVERASIVGTISDKSEPR